MVNKWRTEFIYESRGRLNKSPLMEALIREGEDIVKATELVQPDNPSVIKFREFLNQAREATTPEAKREALVGMEALEDKVRAIVKPPVEVEPVILIDKLVSEGVIEGTQGMRDLGVKEKVGGS